MSHRIHQRFIHFNLMGDVEDLAKRLIPDCSHVEPNVVNASRTLFVAYALYYVDTFNHQDDVYYIIRFMEPHTMIAKDVERLLKKTREIKFSLSEPMKEGYVYVGFDEKADAIGYAIMKGSRCYRGEILDKEYEHFKRRLKKTGVLPLKEVNFLIDKVIIPRRHLKRSVEVVDPLCRQSLSHFLTFEPSQQISAVQHLASSLQPFESFYLRDLFEHGFFDIPSSQEDWDARITEQCHLRDFYDSERLMTYDAINCRDATRYYEQLEREERQSQ